MATVTVASLPYTEREDPENAESLIFGKNFMYAVPYYCGTLSRGVDGGGSCIQEKIMTAETNSGRIQGIHSENRPHDPAALKHWLSELVARNGSDLLLVPNAPASIRFEGVVSPIAEAPLSGEEIEAAVFPVLAAHAREEY